MVNFSDIIPAGQFAHLNIAAESQPNDLLAQDTRQAWNKLTQGGNTLHATIDEPRIYKQPPFKFAYANGAVVEFGDIDVKRAIGEYEAKATEKLTIEKYVTKNAKSFGLKTNEELEKLHNPDYEKRDLEARKRKVDSLAANPGTRSVALNKEIQAALKAAIPIAEMKGEDQKRAQIFLYDLLKADRHARTIPTNKVLETAASLHSSGKPKDALHYLHIVEALVENHERAAGNIQPKETFEKIFAETSKDPRKKSLAPLEELRQNMKSLIGAVEMEGGAAQIQQARENLIAVAGKPVEVEDSSTPRAVAGKPGNAGFILGA